MKPFPKNAFKTIVSLFTLIFFSSGCNAFDTKRYIASEKVKSGKTTQTMLKHSDKKNYYHFLQSEFSKKKGDFQNAITHIEKALEADPDSFFLKKELIKLYIYTNQTPKALANIEKNLKTSPDSIELLMILSQIKLSQNKDREIPPIYEKIISIDPTRETVYYLLGGIYSKLNQVDKAIEVFKGLVKKFPDAVSGYYYLGRLYLVKHDVENAEAAFKKTLKLSPEFKEALSMLTDIYETAKAGDKLFKICQKTLSLYPDDLRASLALSILYKERNMPEKADKLVVNIIKKIPSAQISNGLVRYYLRKKNIKAAIQLLNSFLKIEPDNDKFLYLSGTCFNQINDQKKAMAQFRKIPPASEYYTNAILILAFHNKDQNRNKKAILLLEKAHSNIPENPDFILYLGTFHEENNNLEDALVYYQKGIALNKKSASFHFRAGVIFDKQDNRQKCIDEMKRVIELDPDDTNALNYLGYTYADMGMNLNEAEMLIKKALSHKPDDAYITDSLGWLYYKKGDIKKAKRLLEKAVKLKPDDPILLEHLGDALIKANNSGKALEFYLRSLKNKTKNKEQLLIKIKQINQKD